METQEHVVGEERPPTLPGRFAARVLEDPDRPAIVGVPKPLTYRELAWLADGYRAVVAEHGPTAGGRVAVLLPHDASVVAATLGALAARAAVVVLNASEPASRLTQICADVEPALLLADETHGEIAVAVAPDDTEVVAGPGVFGKEVGALPPLLRVDLAEPDDMAFLISTSGSTGRPKLVMQTHRNMVHNAMRYQKGLDIRADDRIAWSTSLSGGQGLATAWTTLLSGAALCPYSLLERGLVELAPWMQTTGVTVFDTIPTVFRSFLRSLQPGQVLGPRLVRLASEAATLGDFELFRRHFGPTSALATVLGSSEAGIVAQGVLTQSAPGAGRLAVGRPAEGIEISLEDDDGVEVGAGEEGQVVVHSRHLSPGYWRDPALTAARFTDTAGGRILRTGDLARWDPGAGLVVTGRVDSQVKVRGNRVHIEEVESAIARRIGVQDARVLAHTTERGDVTLRAFVVGKPGAELDGGTIQRDLRVELPGYAVPGSVVMLDALPYTAHGKLDRAALENAATRATDAPVRDASEIEAVVADLWREAFERDIGLDEPFLAAGGDSLSAAVVAAGIHDVFGVEVGLDIFVSDPTVAELARLVDGRRATGVAAELEGIQRAPRGGSHPLSCSQVDIWVRGLADPVRQVIASPFDILGPLDVDAFREALLDVIRRHEILRTTYVDRDGVLAAVIRSEPEIEFSVQDLSTLADPEDAAAACLTDESGRPFDLKRGPLLRSLLLRFGDNHHRWIRSNHHMVSDPSSWSIFFDDLASSYERRVAGPGPDREREREPESPQLQFVDYAAWEQQLPERERARFDAAVDRWRALFTEPPPPARFPLGHPAPFEGSPAGLVRWGLPAETSAQLDQLARETHATYFMSRLAPYAALLALDSPTDDVLISMSVSVRGRSELRSVIGPVTNYGLLRCTGATGCTLRQWLRQIRHWVIDLSSRSQVPFRLISPELVRSGVRPTVPHAAFATSLRRPVAPFGGLELHPLPRPCPDILHFKVGVSQAFESDGCWAEFDRRAHDADVVRRYVERLAAFIAASAGQPDAALSGLVGEL
jgi:acyl-coenzyme A synthetase/AMP-(fatty) acid ligase